MIDSTQMKRGAFGLIFTFLTLFSYSQGYRMEVKVAGLSPDQHLILANYYGDNQYVKDSAYIKPGSQDVFVFEGDEKLPNGIYLVVLPRTTYFEIVVDESEDQSKYYITTDTNLVLQDMEVRNMPNNEIFLEFNRFTRKLGNRAQELSKLMNEEDSRKKKKEYQEELEGMSDQVDEKRKEIVQSHPDKFIGKIFKILLPVEVPEAPMLSDGSVDSTFEFRYSRDHYWDHFDMSEEGYIRTPVFHGKLKQYMTQYYLQQPDSVIAAADDIISRFEEAGNKELFKYCVWWITKHYEDSKIICMDKVLWHMATNYYCAGKAYWADSSTINKFCEHAEKIGPTLCEKKAPNMNMPDSTYKRFHELHKIDAEITVVVFWDPKCGHCQKEIPKLQEMYDTLKDQGVFIYAVYTQGDWDGWKKYIRENELTFLNVCNAFGEDKFRKNYNIISTPQIYVLDRNKIIRFKKIGAESVPEIVKFMKKQDYTN